MPSIDHTYRVPDHKGAPASVARAEHAPPLVLLVEDDQTLRDIVARNLEARRYRVASAATCADAIERVQTGCPDVLLLDINLPDGSGWDVLRAMRGQCLNVPTVVMSAVQCSRVRLEEFHPDAYLLKPFPLSALLAAVARLARDGVSAGNGHAVNVHAVDGHDVAGGALNAPSLERQRSTPTATEMALVDLVADPDSDITRASLIAASSESIERVEQLARERGLLTTSACSPSLRRGWIVVRRSDQADDATARRKV